MRLKLFLSIGISFVWFYSLFNFYKSDADFSNQTNEVEGIVLLTGGKDRIQTGMALFKELNAKRILISGVDRTVKLSVIKDKQLKGYDDIYPFTDLGYGAVNTFSNALEAAFWVQKHQFLKVGLVTSRFHMPRSLWLFKRAMPDIAIFPIVVDGKDFSFFNFLREYSKYYLTKIVSAFLFDGYNELVIL